MAEESLGSTSSGRRPFFWSWRENHRVPLADDYELVALFEMQALPNRVLPGPTFVLGVSLAITT